MNRRDNMKEATKMKQKEQKGKSWKKRMKENRDNINQFKSEGKK